MKHNSTVVSQRYSSKTQSFAIETAKGITVIVGEKLLVSIAASQGLTNGQLLRNMHGADILFTTTDVKKDQPVLDSKGVPVMDKSGKQVLYTKDHTRFSDINVSISERRVANIEKAEALARVELDIRGFAFSEQPALELPPMPEAPTSTFVETVAEAEVAEEPVLDENATTA